MNQGTYISGLLHLLVIGWVLLADLFGPGREPPLTVAEVSILTGDEFAALTAPASAPLAETEAPTPPTPTVETPVPSVPEPEPETRPEVAEAPVPQPEPEAEAAPDLSQITPLPPEAEVEDTAPLPPTPPVEEPGTAIVQEDQRPAPAPRVAPIVAPAPPQDAEIDEQVRESATPSPDAAPEAPAEPATAPEQAAPEIVTEAEEAETGSFAPLASARPRSRPTPPVTPPAAAEPQAPDAIGDALAEAMSGGSTETSGAGRAPSGPPLTRGEKDALRVAVSSCWNVAALSTDALRTTVIVGVSMTEDAKPKIDTIRMISYSGGSDASARQTYESARRAIIRCGARGFDLPREKYDHWRDIEMTFNPEKMRIK